MVMGKAMVPPVLPSPAWHRRGVDRRFLVEAVRRATVPGRPRLEVLGPAPSAADTVGLVAGSFDPMTAAHAALAEALDTELTLLVWSPATLPKEAGPGGDPSAALLLPEDRLASVAAWCGSRPWARVATCSHGLLVDQVQAAAASFPRSRLVRGPRRRAGPPVLAGRGGRGLPRRRPRRTHRRAVVGSDQDGGAAPGPGRTLLPGRPGGGAAGRGSLRSRPPREPALRPPASQRRGGGGGPRKVWPP